MPHRRLVIVAAIIIGAFTAGGVEAAVMASASSVALHTSDVPAGYSFKSKLLTNAGMVSFSGLPRAQFDQHGRITGLQNEFSRGAYQIFSFVSQYKTVAGATWEYTRSAASDLRRGKAGAAPKVGERSAGWVQTVTLSNGAKRVAYGIDFQKGVYDMTLVVSGPPGKVSISSAAHYAQIMAGRAH